MVKNNLAGGDKAFYRIELYNYQTGLVNINIDCTNHEITYEFLNRLIECIVNIDKNDLTKRIYEITSEINSSLETINRLSNILKND